MPEGEIEFLGRLDYQVKIRGFRIELQEIEKVLDSHPAVREAIVVVKNADRQNGEPWLLCYYTVKDGQSVESAELKSFLKGRLPEYFTPTAFVLLPKFPLSPNGKVDRRALADLPEPTAIAASKPAITQGAKGQYEGQISQIWRDVLRRDAGLDDNFFDSGGDSIQLAQVHAALIKALGVDFPITDLFAHTTIRAQARHFARLKSGESTILAGEEKERISYNEPIAIVGMAGRFPGARNVEQFWKNLTNGVETISRFKDGELEFTVASPEAREVGQKFMGARGVLDDVDQFDASFFGIYPREAEMMDPQHRLFLECAWESLEMGGYDPERYPGAIGVYAGTSMNTYLLHNLMKDREFAASFTGNYQVGQYSTMLGNDKDFLPTRVSYKLNLKGPSMAVQTACSTSLVAVAQACASLQTGQCDMALAGGVSITFPQRRDYVYEEDGMMSADGKIRAFDSEARGTVFGHGVAVVLLKRLSDALADKDNIIAVIKGAAVNNDGCEKIGFAAPSVTAQANVIAKAQQNAGVDPESVTYIEAHGTGTPLGDPIEVAALTQAFKSRGAKAKGYCALGTAKGYISHIDVAAGATGLIKTALQLQHGLIPPLLNFKSPNPKIDFANSPFFPVTETLKWERGATPRRAGVSAFGVGGTNAHVVVEEAPDLPPTGPSRSSQLLLLSAKSETALQTMAKNLGAFLENNPEASLADIAFTLQNGRKNFAQRRIVVATDHTEAIARLNAAPAKDFIGKAPQQDQTVVFMFPGQGAQHVEMGRDLFDSEPVFRAEVDRCAEILQKHLGVDIREVIYPDASKRDEAEKKINETWITQPSIFVVEYALAKLWMSWGIKPSVLIGHSIGEYVCAVMAESMTLDGALSLLSVRAKLMQSLPTGSMMAVRLGAVEVEPLLPTGASIAAVNSTAITTVSGPTEVLQQFQKDLEAKKVASKFLPTSHAFHSASMDPILPAVTAAAEKIERREPKLRWVSTCTATWMTPEDLADAGYWARQLRHTVQFSKALDDVIGAANHIFVEVGPGQTLVQLARQHPKKSTDLRVYSTLGTENIAGADTAAILGTLGKLWMNGVQPNWNQFCAKENRRRVPLPTYPFERKRFWVDPPSGKPLECSPLQNVIIKTDVTAPPQHPAVTPIIIQPPTLVGPSGPEPGAMTQNRKEKIKEQLKTMFQELSGSDQSQLDPTASFLELGFDSLFLTQASQAIQSRLRVKVTFRQMMGDLSNLDALAGFLETKLPPEPASAPTAAPMPTAAPPPVARSIVAAQAAPMPTLDAMPAQSVYGAQLMPPAASDCSLVERVFQQQMALMAQQIDLLRGGGAAIAMPAAAPSLTPSVATTVPSVTPAGPYKPVVVAAKHEKEDTKRFGPFKGIEKGSTGDLTPRQQTALDRLIARYNKRTAKSKALAQAHREKFCDPRTAGNFRQLWKEMVYPIACAKSKGSRIWDIDGNEYLDLTMGFGTNYLGHAPDYVTEAVERQLKLGYEIGPQSPLAGEVAEMICEMTGMERATFCNTGSEAVMAAFRVARTVTGKEKVVYFYGDYHGIFDEVLGRPAMVDGRPGAMPFSQGVPHLANVIILEYGSPAALETIQQYAEDIAAVIVEPVQSRRPDLQPREFLQSLRKLTEQKEIALIFDEVITGFRAALGGAQEYFGVRADMASYGKVIGGGMPIGVLAGKAKYMDALDGGFWQFGDGSSPPTGVTFFAGTFVRHPLAMAAAHAALSFLKKSGPNLQRETNERTGRFVRRMNEHFEKIEVPIRLQWFCAMFYYDFHPDLKYANLLFYYMRDKGIHIWEGRVGHSSVVHTDEDMDRLFNAFKESVEEMQADGFLPSKNSSPANGESANGHRIAAPAATPARGSASVLNVQNNRLADARDRFPLTEGQMEMWLGAQMGREAAGPHHASNAVRLIGELDIPKLQRAIEQVVQRHEALRSVFSADGSEIIINPSTPIEVTVDDLTSLVAVDRDARAIEIQKEEGRRLFDLNTGPLFNFRIVNLGPREHLLIFTVQMIVCDGWGYNIVLEEISALYSAAVENREITLDAPTPMRAYAEWQKNSDPKTAEECEAFWMAQFKTLPPPFELPSFRPRPPARGFDGERQNLRLSAEFFREIKRVSRELKVTPFALLLAAYETWLHRLSGLNDFVIGVPFAGQSGSELESLVGQCVHTLPLRVKVDAKDSFAEVLNRAKASLMDAQEHWNYGFGKLVQKLDLPRDQSRIPLVSVLFNLDPPLSKVKFSGCSETITACPRAFFQYDLGFNLVDEGETLLVECDYNTAFIDPASVRSWLSHFRSLLEGIVAQPSECLAKMPMLNALEREKLVSSQFATSSGTIFAPVHEIFTQQASRVPDAIAIESKGQRLTYSQLHRRSSQVAALIQSLGVKKETLVGVCLERTTDVAVAILGILKAGAAYVPIEVDQPADRIAAIFEDIAAPVILSHGSLLPNLPSTSARIVCLDDDRDIFGAQSPGYAPTEVGANDLAYVIYTSGSTGKPKGVEISHGGLANFLASMQKELRVTERDAFLGLTTISFDIATLEILLPLTLGARCSMVTREVLLNPAELDRVTEQNGITVIQATPATWRLLVNGGWKGSANLKVLCGGEALPADLAERLLVRCGELWNMYGPTETTVWSTISRVKKGEPIVIGHPIANTQVFVLDEFLQPVPTGVAGEIYIGGAGLARKYRNEPGLTTEKFVVSPFGKNGERLYRTGDTARYCPNGEIEFLGRRDFQVKLRGYRIELGEIEAALLSNAAVREAAVVIREDVGTEPQLVAYVAVNDADQNGKIRAELRQAVRGRLPDYMLPAAIVTLKSLPRTAEGKTDRRSLPAPESVAFDISEAYVAPRNKTEERLARLWCEALKVPKVGLRDNFFDLGGRSLTAVALFGKIQVEFGRRLPLSALLRAPTVEELACELSGEAKQSDDWACLVPIQPRGSKPPLFLVHGAGGNVLLYRALAEHLDPDQPLYGLQSKGLDGQSEPLKTIEDMAVQYLREIRKVQPHGPYYLGGYCLGGTVAYEMAQILTREGESAPMIAMLDTYNFSRALKVNFSTFLYEKIRFHVGNFAKLRPRDMWDYVKEKVRVARDGELANILTSAPGTSTEDGVTRAETGVEASVQACNDHAADNYLPKPYQGCLTLFKPQINYKFYPDPKMGWGDLALGGLDMVELPMNPHAMLVEPFVKTLAVELSTRLEKLQKRTVTITFNGVVTNHAVEPTPEASFNLTGLQPAK